MQITISLKKLGPLKNPSVKIAPLTVFIGPNNTGKTYMAYFSAGILENFPISCPTFGSLVKGKEIKLKTRDVQNAWIEDWKKFLVKKFLPNFWEDYFAIKNHEIVGLEINYERGKERLSSQKFKIKDRQFVKFEIDYGYLDITFEPPLRSEEIKVEKICKYIPEFLGLPSKVLIVPAERDVYLIYRHWFILKNRLLEMRQSETAEEIGRVLGEIKFPKPFEKYLEFLLMIPEKKEGPLSLKLARFLNKLLGGEIKIKPEDFWFRFNDKEIKISGASSGVKTLLPFEFILNYANKGELIVIDEPETHLHPKAQVMFTIALAWAVNEGLRFIITTHSPYIVDTLNFLTMAYEFKKVISKKHEERFKELLFNEPLPIEEPEHSLLNHEKLSIYYFGRDGSIRNIKQVKGKLDIDIDWKTFSEVSDALWEKFYELGKLKDALENEHFAEK